MTSQYDPNANNYSLTINRTDGGFNLNIPIPEGSKITTLEFSPDQLFNSNRI